MQLRVFAVTRAPLNQFALFLLRPCVKTVGLAFAGVGCVPVTQNVRVERRGQENEVSILTRCGITWYRVWLKNKSMGQMDGYRKQGSAIENVLEKGGIGTGFRNRV